MNPTVCWGPLVVVTARRILLLSVLAHRSRYSELDCEENNLELRLFEKVKSPTPK